MGCHEIFRIATDMKKPRFFFCSRLYNFPLVVSTVNCLHIELTFLDIKTAFLYGKIDRDDVYLEIKYDRTAEALRLRKALYGLKISSKIWFAKLRCEILRVNYSDFHTDQCVFYRKDYGRIRIIIIVCIDDILFASNCRFWIEETIETLKMRF